MNEPLAPSGAIVAEGEVAYASPERESEQDALRSEFTAWYHAAYPRLAGQLQAITGDAAGVPEAAQEAFARAWQRWRVVRGLDDPASWVRRVALRVLDRRPRLRRRPSSPPNRGSSGGFGDPAHAAAMDPQNLVVLDALRQLPVPERRALVLHHMAGLPIPAVAAEEGVAESTVQGRLSRGRAALADLLADVDDGEEFEGGLV